MDHAGDGCSRRARGVHARERIVEHAPSARITKPRTGSASAGFGLGVSGGGGSSPEPLGGWVASARHVSSDTLTHPPRPCPARRRPGREPDGQLARKNDERRAKSFTVQEPWRVPCRVIGARGRLRKISAHALSAFGGVCPAAGTGVIPCPLAACRRSVNAMSITGLSVGKQATEQGSSILGARVPRARLDRFDQFRTREQPEVVLDGNNRPSQITWTGRS